MSSPVNIFWFRRDLRTEDNHGLYEALKKDLPVLPVFIFDEEILKTLPQDDARVNFIHQRVQKLHNTLNACLLVEKGIPTKVFDKLCSQYNVKAVYTNHDYEPYALERDRQIKDLLGQKDVAFHTFKDQVIFEKEEVVKNDGKPYTIFTPYKNKWFSQVTKEDFSPYPSEKHLKNLMGESFKWPTLADIGFKESYQQVLPYNLDVLGDYENTRNIPSQNGTSLLSPHLRFGTVSVRQLAGIAKEQNETFLSELAWREFYMQILYHFPKVVNESFKPKYDQIEWVNDEKQFEKWCTGKTGYPMVDAGMRELNKTGYMHNRVRMVVASFLTKHLLIDWRWGEAYFAEKLLDFELSSNNGNWQWAAGTGCDAAPYFRVFNPTEQLKKFDPQMKYIKKWLGSDLGKYPPIIEHKFGRKRALETYKKALDQ